MCLTEFYKSDDECIEISQPFFWYMTGITIYATGTVVFYSLWYIAKSDPAGKNQVIKVIHHFFNCLLYLSFSIGLLKNKGNSRTST